MSDIEARVKKIIAEQLGVEESQVTSEKAFVADLGADSLDTVELDAQSFDIHAVSIWENADWKGLEYRYDGKKLKIALDETKTREDTFKVFVKYTANPERVTAEGGSAINDAKGLYFINGKNEFNESKNYWAPEI